MKLVYEGKTKTVFELPDGNFLLKFKDDATGENGVFDPGANSVGLSIDGMGISNLRVSDFFFRMINAAGIPTHFIGADFENAAMTVRPAGIFGSGLEIVCRYRAVGSFLRRYGLYVRDGQPLDALVEVTLKDDDRGDPLITKDALEMLGILTGQEYGALKDLMKKTCGLIKDALAKKGMELYDIKLEFGRVDGGVALIDEISAGCMRVYKDGRPVEPLDLAQLLLD